MLDPAAHPSENTRRVGLLHARLSDDWAIARMAEALGCGDTAREYYRRALNYVNVFDGSTRFFRGRRSDGRWTTPFEEFATGRDYTEATPWHYRFFAPHDINGLEQLFGDRTPFVDELDRLFTLTSEEMQLDVADDARVSWDSMPTATSRATTWPTSTTMSACPGGRRNSRALLDEMYAPTPEGIIGNEDCGQMSAWYIFSSLGFYPVCPGSNEFVLTTPLF